MSSTSILAYRQPQIASTRATGLYASDSLLLWVDRYRWPLLIALLAGYCAAFNGQWQLEPDSALYLSLARNIAAGRGYTYHDQPHDLAYPGFPYALAALLKIFGPYTGILAANVLMLCSGLATLALTYRLVFLYSNRANAVVITLMTGICRTFVRYCYEIMTDMPFLLGVMAFLVGYEAIFTARSQGRGKGRWYDWLLLVAGLLIAVTTRPTMIGLVVIAIGVTLWLAIVGRLPRLWTLGGIGLVAAAIVAFVLLDPRRSGHPGQIDSYEAWALDALTHNFKGRAQIIIDNVKDLFGLTAARSVFGMPLGTWYLNAIWGTAFLICGVMLIRKRAVWGLWICATVAMLILVVSHDRYVLQILPLLMIGVWKGLCWVNRKLPRQWGNLAFAGVIAVLLILNIIQFITIIVVQHRYPFLAYYKEGRFPGYIATARELEKQTTRSDLILCPQKYARILTYLSDRKVAENGEPESFQDLSQYNLYVVQDPADAEFQQFLASKNITLQGPELFSAPRAGVKPRPPVSLWQARVGPALR